MAKTQIGECDKGDGGTPGTDYTGRLARVYRLRSGRYELYVRATHGSNQGYLEEHGRTVRTFRASSIDELMRVGVAEIRQDSELWEGASSLVAAIRGACFEAEDAEAEAEEPGNAA